MPKFTAIILIVSFWMRGIVLPQPIELNPDTGCQTYTPDEETELGNWEEEEELDEWEAMGTPEEIKDDWDDDDDDDDLDDDQDSIEFEFDL